MATLSRANQLLAFITMSVLHDLAPSSEGKKGAPTVIIIEFQYKVKASG